MGKGWFWAILLLDLTAWSPARGDAPIACLGPGECWLDIPVLKQDPNTLKIPPGVIIPEVLSGWRTHDCPSGAYLHMTRWVCLVWYEDLLASPDPYYGKDVRTRGVIHVAPNGQLFLMPATDMADGPERIRVEGAASSLPPLKDGQAIYLAGRFEPEGATHAPGLGVLSNAHDVVISKEDWTPESLLPGLQLKTPKTVASKPPKFAIAPGAR